MPKFIEFVPNGDDWIVRNKGYGSWLGDIAWYPAWRQHVFVGNPSAVFSHECLADIGAFLRERTAERLKGPAKGAAR